MALAQVLFDKKVSVCVHQLISGYRSSILLVISGVPQGSILGPILFLLYVNDLPDHVKTSIVSMFADDVKCARPLYCYSDHAPLQEDLDSLIDWSHQWKLNFKRIQCTHLCCSNKRSSVFDTIYSLNDENIPKQDSYKDLGLMISSDLSFSKHYSYITLSRTFSLSTNAKEKRSYTSA